MSETRLQLVPAELVTEPEPAEVKERLFQLWSWHAGYVLARALRLLRTELDDAGHIKTPTPEYEAVRVWIRVEGWRERADAELRREYVSRDREAKEKLWKLQLLHIDMAIEDATGGRPMTKEAVALFKTVLQARGVGSYGAIMGGEVTLAFPATESERKELTTQERSREQRQRTMEENRGIS